MKSARRHWLPAAGRVAGRQWRTSSGRLNDVVRVSTRGDREPVHDAAEACVFGVKIEMMFLRLPYARGTYLDRCCGTSSVPCE